MLRFLTSAMLGAALMLAPMGAAPAAAQTTGTPNELARVLGGIAALGVLGLAIKKARDGDDDDDRKRWRDRDRDRDRWRDHDRGRHGYRDFDRGRHGYRDHDRDRRGRGARELRGRGAAPSACLRQVRTRQGIVRLYDKGCLDRFGWTVARRN